MSSSVKLRRVVQSVCSSIEEKCATIFGAPYGVRGNHECERLEERRLLSVAASINGPATVTEGSAYVLSLTASSTANAYTVNNWTISYGDGTTHTLFGNSVADLYTYQQTSSPSYVITATVGDTENGVSYTGSTTMAVTVETASASVSLAGDTGATINSDYVVTETLSDPGSHTLSAYSISWGDGATTSDSGTPLGFTGSYADTLTHTYADSGTYSVTASADTEQGTVTAATSVVAAPVFYAADDGNGFTVGQAFDLTPTFTDPGHTLASYTVSWGDGSTDNTYSSSATLFTHDYATDSSTPYSVTLTAVADDGTWTATTEADVAPPTLSVSGSGSTTQGVAYSLDASVQSGQAAGDNYNFTIDWGDGSSPESVTSPAGVQTYTYSQVGTYSISVSVDGNGGGDIAEATVAVAVATPTISVSAVEQDVTAGIGVDFTDSYSNVGGDSVDNLSVDWGDGNSDAYYLDPGSSNHTYATAGTYDVTDTFVTDDGTYAASTSVEVTDAGSLSLSIGGGDGAQIVEGSFQTISANFSDPNGDTPTSYHVSWGDGATDDGGPETHGEFTHMYTAASSDAGYTISATATTPDGTYDAAPAVNTVQVAGVQISAESNGDASGGEPLPVAVLFYDGQPSLAYPVPGHPVSYQVDWGDGNTDTFSSPTFSHEYTYDTSSTATNMYAYTVVAQTDEQDMTCSNVVTVHPPGQGSISLDVPSTVVENQTLALAATFSDSNQDSISGYGPGSWTVWWGDGSGGGTQNVNGEATYSDQASYTQPGTYEVTVAAGFSETGVPDPGHTTYATQQVVVSVDTPTITAVGDTNATVTGDTYSLAVSYNQYVESPHQPQKWLVAWGDGTSDIYYDQTPNPTHVYATGSTSGTQYSPQIQVVTDEGTFSPTQAPSVLVAQPQLVVLASDGSTLSTEEEHSTGAFLLVNDNNDGYQFDSSGNPISDYLQNSSTDSADPDLLPVTVKGIPEIGGTYSISWNGVRLWEDSNKATAATDGEQFSASSDRTFYVEAGSITPVTGGAGISLNWTGAFGAVANAVAWTKLTALQIQGVQNAPAFGTFKYSTNGAIPAGALGASPWSANRGQVATVAAGGTNSMIFWNGGDPSPPYNGLLGSVNFKVGPFTLKRQVNLVWLGVTEGNPYSFSPGSVIQDPNGKTLQNETSHIQSLLVQSTLPALAWLANVTLLGPHNNRGVDRVKVGFVQNLNNYTNIGYYQGAPSSLVSDIHKALPLLDGDGVSPWYPSWPGPYPLGFSTPPATFFNATATDNTAQIGSLDMPQILTPLTYEQIQSMPNLGNHVLNATTVEDTFELDVVIEPKDTNNEANTVYTRRATATWAFNASGIVDSKTYAWTPNGAGITAPTSWAEVTNGSSPITGGAIANTVVPHETFKPQDA
jgi:hypothetical protein